eukprot:Awhi_evm1s6584
MSKTNTTMRALVYEDYGPPKEVLKLVNNRKIPSLEENEVLVKVECATVNAADKHMVEANYLIIRLLLGFFRPAPYNQILGMDISGTITSVGEKVEGFQIGDDVAADIRTSYGGGFAEYVAVKVDNLVKKPANVSFEQAACVPISGQAAMMGVILCNIKPGDKVLINGASGGVGSFGIKLAKHQGAHVTALCSAAKVIAVKSWGADEVIDYAKTPITDLESNKYDAVFDAASFENPSIFSETMKSDGRYVLVGGDYYNMIKLKLTGRFYGRGTQQFKTLSQDESVNDNIANVLDLIAQGTIKPAITDTIRLGEVPSALQKLKDRTVVGKVVIKNQM